MLRPATASVQVAPGNWHYGGKGFAAVSPGKKVWSDLRPNSSLTPLERFLFAETREVVEASVVSLLTLISYLLSLVSYILPLIS